MPDPRLATLLPGDYGRIYTHPVTREQHVSSTTVLKVLAKKLDGWAGGEAAGAAWDNRAWLMQMTREEAVAAFGEASNRVRNAAGDHGNLVHKGWELLAMSYGGWTLTPEQSATLTAMLTGAQGPKVQQGVLRFAEWWKTYVSEPLFLEQTVWGNGWAGTFDWIVRLIDGRISLVDGKSSKAIYRDPKLQLASYWGAPVMVNAEGVVTEMPHIDLCTILHVPQAGGYTFLDLEVNADDLEVFEKLIEVWHWTQDVPPNPGVPIPVATAPWVPGVRHCGQHRPSKSGQAGTVACIEPQGHPGQHHGKSKTGSRHYYWSDQDAPGAAASPPFADAERVPPEPPALRPVPSLPGPSETSPEFQERTHVSQSRVAGSGSSAPGADTQDGGAGTDSSDTHSVAPVLGSNVPEAPAVVAPSAQPPALDVPGPDEGSSDESAARSLAGASPVPAPVLNEYAPLDDGQAYSAKISQLFSKPGEA